MDVSFLTSAFCQNHYPPPDRPEVAFAGKSNVGKSSLINVLANRKGLAITSTRPGRTQSINFFLINNILYFVDLPGYGFARVPIRVKKSWQQMVETYLRSRSNLRAVVVILDIRRNLTSGDIDLLNWLRHYHIHAITVLTKADKIPRQQAMTRAHNIGRQFEDISSTAPMVFSAKTRQGRNEIWEKIIRITGSELRIPS